MSRAPSAATRRQRRKTLFFQRKPPLPAYPHLSPHAPTSCVSAQRLNALIAADHPVTETWITDAELEASPGLVKTMAVKPPTGQGRVRLVRIGPEEAPVDLQPCGGTHVRSTAEIGPVRIGKVEKKGRQNRRVTLLLGA